MAVFLAPSPVQGTFFIPGSNTPANGGKVFFYVAGSSTKQTVFKDSAGSVSHTNPIVLDSGGNIPSGAEVWFTSGVIYKVIFAPSTDTDPPVSPYWTKDNLSGINDVAAQTGVEWLTGPTPTFVSTTSFTLAGDQTSTFMVGRRVKTTNTGGTIYSVITASAFGAVTTVTVLNDAGVLDSGLSAVSYGLLSALNPSVPILQDINFLVSGSADLTKKLRLEVDGLTTATTRVGTVPDYDFRMGNLPAGVIMDYAGSSIPTGWLECDGSVVSRTTYAALFTAISTTWNRGGEAGTDFRLPDFRSRVRVGRGAGVTTETVTASSGNGFTVASFSTKWVTGMPVVLSALSGFTTSATAGPTYYVVVISGTNIRLATTLVLAQNLTPDVTISGSGSCTLTYTMSNRSVGGGGGEETHAMTINELIAHGHNVNSSNTGGTGGVLTGTATINNTTNNATQTGGAVAMNIMQPFAVTMTIISL